MSRQLELVKLLYEEKTFQPSEYFSKKLSISTKTLYGELTNLNEKFHSLGLNANITKLPRKGIIFSCELDDFEKIIQFLSVGDHHSFFNENAIRLSPYYRKLDILKRNILNAEKTSLDKLSKKYLVSKTSIIKDLNEISDRLNKDKVVLKVNQNQITIYGDEVQIQTAIKNFLLFYLDKKNDKYINELINRFFTEHLFVKIKELFFSHILKNQSCSEHYLFSLLLSLTIQVKRLSLGFTIKSDNDFLFNHIRYLQSFVLASNFIQPMCQVYNVDYSSNDINYLSKIFFTHRLVDEDASKNNEESYAIIIKEIIRKVGEIEDVDLLEDELLYKSLFNHFPAMIARLQKNIEIINPILDEVKKEYSTLFSVLWYALSNLEMNLNIHFNDHEISFLLIHFQVALDRIANANNIVLLYPKGQSSFSLLLNKIKQILPARDNLEVRSFDQLNLSGLDNVNLVISTVEVKLTEDIPVVKISPLVTKSDYKKKQNLISNMCGINR